MSRHDGYWATNPDQIERARLMWEAGDSSAAIGRVFGVSKNAIIGLKNRQRTWTPRESPIKKLADGAVRPIRRRVYCPSPKTLAPLLSLFDDPILLTAPPRERPAPKQKPVVEVPRVVRESNLRCEWRDGDKPFVVRCGHKTVFGYPYCAEHCSAAYINWRGAAVAEAA